MKRHCGLLHHVGRGGADGDYDWTVARANADYTKVIAFDLDISPRTVEIHRARVMEKMRVRSVAELVRLMERAQLPEGAPR